MSENICRDYLVTGREFMVLAALEGIGRMPFLSAGRTREVGREELAYLLFELYQKEILNWKDGGSYEIRPEFRRLLEIIKSREDEPELYRRKDGEPVLCFQDGRTAVLVSREKGGDVIRLYGVSQKELPDSLKERALSPAES